MILMSREIYKIYDFIMKLIIIFYLNEFLMYIGEERKIVEILNTEIPTLNGKTRYLDYLCRLDDCSLCNIEFEFPVAYSQDLERFFDYNIVVQIDQGEITESIVINFTKKGIGSEKIDIGKSKSFHPKNVYLGDIDYIKELEKIKEKVNTNCTDRENVNKDKESNILLTYEEELHLLIMCLIPKYKDKTKLLIEIFNVLKNEKAFRKEKLQIIKAIINLEIKNLIPKEDQKYFEGEENMNEELGEIMTQAAKEVNKKYEQRALEKAKEEGIKEGKKEIAKKLKETHTPEEISKITGLTLQTILLL